MTTPALDTMTLDINNRRVPRLGGFSLTYLGLELRRMVRNRRTMIFTFVMPSAFFLLFGTGSDQRHERAGQGNVTAYVLISMAVYGALLATTSGGASVSIERSLGWSRQLRLTPLNPIAYVVVKLLVAMSLGLGAILVVNLVGWFSHSQMPLDIRIETLVISWLCSVVFAGFGLFMGYLLPSDNVMQILGPSLALLSFAGGLFVPLDQMGHTFATIAKFMPTYGVGVIARYPLTDDGNLTVAILNVLVWTAVFVAGTAWRFRKDTARV